MPLETRTSEASSRSEASTLETAKQARSSLLPSRRDFLRSSIGALVACTLPHEAEAETTQEKVARLLRDLGDDEFTVREKASAELLLLVGPETITPIETATRDPDLERARRAERIADTYWNKYYTELLKELNPQYLLWIDMARDAGWVTSQDCNHYLESARRDPAQRDYGRHYPEYRRAFEICVGETLRNRSARETLFQRLREKKLAKEGQSDREHLLSYFRDVERQEDLWIGSRQEYKDDRLRLREQAAKLIQQGPRR